MVAPGQGAAAAGPFPEVGRREGGRLPPEGSAGRQQGREHGGNQRAQAAQPSRAASLRPMRGNISTAWREGRLLLQAMRRPGPERKDPPRRNDPARLRAALRRKILRGNRRNPAYPAGAATAVSADAGAALRPCMGQAGRPRSARQAARRPSLPTGEAGPPATGVVLAADARSGSVKGLSVPACSPQHEAGQGPARYPCRPGHSRARRRNTDGSSSHAP